MAPWYLTRKTARDKGDCAFNFNRTGIAVSGDEYTITASLTSTASPRIYAIDSPDVFTIEFDIKRVLQDANHEVILNFNGFGGSGAVLTWDTTTGQWVLSGGSPDTDCGTVGADTWCHIKATINRTTTVVTIQIDNNTVRTRTDADHATCYGIYFSRFEGQTNPNETFIKNITVDYARPVRTTANRVINDLSPYPDGEINGSVGVQGQLGISTFETKDGVAKAIKKNGGYHFYLFNAGHFVSGMIYRCTFWALEASKARVLFGLSVGSTIAIEGEKIYLTSTAGTELGTYTKETWVTLDVRLVTSGTNTIINVRTNGGAWGADGTTGYDFPASSYQIIYNDSADTAIWWGPKFYLLDEGWITPTLSSPADIEMTEGDSETLSWTPTGDGGTYTISDGSSTVASGAWTSGVPITYDLDETAIGEYTFTCEITDTIDTVDDDVSVTIVTGSPSLSSPDNIEMTIGDSETISWTPTGVDSLSGTYAITRGATSVATGAWTSGTPITFDLSTQPAGTYTFTCTITEDGKTAADSVGVSIASLEAMRFLLDLTSPIVETVTFSPKFVTQIDLVSEARKDVIDFRSSVKLINEDEV